MDREIVYDLHRFRGDYENTDDLGQPDSILSYINKLVKKEPGLQYAPVIVSFTFGALLRTNPHEAYKFGKEAIKTSTYTEPAYAEIIGTIEGDTRKIKFPAEIYRLGAEAYQAKIDNRDPKTLDLPKLYRRIGAYYRKRGI